MRSTYNLNKSIGHMNMQTAEPKNCILYARTATKKKPDEANSIKEQLGACSEIAERNGYKIFARCIDEGYSANTDKRPGLKRLIRSCKLYNIEYVIVAHIDRLARRIPEYFKIKSELNQCGTKIISCNLPEIDNAFFESILLSVSDFYSQEQSRRIKEGLRRHKERMAKNAK